jgi:hypothetical protein
MIDSRKTAFFKRNDNFIYVYFRKYKLDNNNKAL